MKKRVLTGDRPTGKLHLGHYIGSIRNRVEAQKNFTCFLILADLHTLTTKPSKQEILAMRTFLPEMVADYLACGIDPNETVIYLQSQIPAVYQLNTLFSMMVSLNRLSGLPSIKEMAKNAHIDEESIPFGLVGYPVLQTADILCGKADVVPVGRDNLAHIELARDIARRFNMLYGDVFPLPVASLPGIEERETVSLIGLDGKGKMSKSANNALFLSDDTETVRKKIQKMYTDPNRVHAHIPGKVEGNPLFIFHDLFNADKEQVAFFKERYQEGNIRDVEIKEALIASLEAFLTPIREKRTHFLQQKGYIEKVLVEGTRKMQEISHATLKEALSAMGLNGMWSKLERVSREYNGSAL